MNYETQTAEMLLDMGFNEVECKNKQWRIFFESKNPDMRWFIHTSGKARRGEKLHRSKAITEEVRAMLSDWLAG